MKLDLTGLFKYLKSEECSLFFQNVLPENKTEIIENMLGNEEFLSVANQFVPDVAIIREQLGNYLTGILKKKTAVPVPVPVPLPVPLPMVEINLYSGLGCLRTPEAFKVDALRASDPRASYQERDIHLSGLVPRIEVKPDPIVFVLEEEIFDEEEEDTGSKGTHVGNGIYLLREEHRIKMTTPDFVVYY
jgi:hypothetical protein